MHKLWFFIIGVVLLVAAFLGAFPASIYAAQQFNTNLIVGVFGVFFTSFAFIGKNGS